MLRARDNDEAADKFVERILSAGLVNKRLKGSLFYNDLKNIERASNEDDKVGERDWRQNMMLELCIVIEAGRAQKLSVEKPEQMFQGNMLRYKRDGASEMNCTRLENDQSRRVNGGNELPENIHFAASSIHSIDMAGENSSDAAKQGPIYLGLEIMNDNFEGYTETIDRLKSGDRSTFRNDLEILAQKFGSFRPLDDVAGLACGNPELLRELLKMTKENPGGNLGLLAFHSARQVGPTAITYIREAWQSEEGATGNNKLHMCLLDIIGASPNKEEWKRQMPIIAEEEVPLWMELLRGEKNKSRGLIGWALGALTQYTPAQAKRVGQLIIELLSDYDALVQAHAVKGLLCLGDKTLLQDALFRLARDARDEMPLEVLLYRIKDIDINAGDGRGKTALVYAEESGNKSIAEMLEKAGAKKSQLPKISDFPSGTKFVIKEFDVPLVWIPHQGWFNWFGGAARPYDESFLRVDNNWLAGSFEEWISVVEESLR